jgi:hypothetical protein
VARYDKINEITNYNIYLTKINELNNNIIRNKNLYDTLKQYHYIDKSINYKINELVLKNHYNKFKDIHIKFKVLIDDKKSFETQQNLQKTLLEKNIKSFCKNNAKK